MNCERCGQELVAPGDVKTNQQCAGMCAEMAALDMLANPDMKALRALYDFGGAQPAEGSKPN